MKEVRLGLGASRLAHTTDIRTQDTRVVHCLGVWSSFCMSKSRKERACTGRLHLLHHRGPFAFFTC